MSPAYSKKSKKDPKQDIKTLNEIIETKGFRPVHLLCGEEDYLRIQFRDSLTEAMGGVKGSLCFDRFIGKEVSPARIIDLAETLPFMSERRVILIEDTGWFKSGCAEMEAYIEQGVCETTCIVFCEKETDKRLKLYKAVEKHGLVSEFTVQDETTLSSWLYGRFRNADITIGRGEAEYMINVVGTDMLCLSNEAEKLIAYCMDRGNVTRSDIDAICTRRLEDKIFDMCEAVAMNRRERAMSLYYDLIALRESPIKILVLVTRQFDTLLKIKDMEARRYSDERMGAAIGRPAWTMRGYKAQTSRYSLSELKSIVNLCADTDMSVKSGVMSEDIAMETLMVRLTYRKQTAG